MEPGQSLRNQRCFNHAGREAAARCPVCGRDFCRECITEHHGRMLCSLCLAAENAGKKARFNWIAPLVLGFLLFSALICCWILFYCVGRILSYIPDQYHELPETAQVLTGEEPGGPVHG